MRQNTMPCLLRSVSSKLLLLDGVAVDVAIEGTERKTKHPNTQLMFGIHTILVTSYKNKRDRSAITRSLIHCSPRPSPEPPFPIPPIRHSAS